MSATNSIGDFDLNLVTLRKPLEFANGTIQSTAYQGAGGVPTLTEVLTAGNNAGNKTINNLNSLNCTAVNAVGLFASDKIIVTGDSGFITISRSNGSQINQSSLNIVETTSSTAIKFSPRAGNNTWNPLVQNNDAVIASTGLGTPLTLAVQNVGSTMTNGLRITNTFVQCGAGGTSDAPSNNITIDGNTNTTTLTGTSLNVNNTNVEFTSLTPPKFDGGIKFADNTIQTTASVPSTSVALYNNSGNLFSLTQPTWNVSNLYPVTISTGVYQATVFFQLLNASLAPITFDYFNIIINGGVSNIAKDSSPNWSLKNGDDIYRNTSLVFVSNSTQSVSLQLQSNITSGAFSGTAPTVQIFSYLLTKIASYP